MNAADARREYAVNELFATLNHLQPRSDLYAAKLKRDCWGCIAELLMGGHCEEVAHTLVLSAEHWLEDAA